ncbi:MAG: hypothetical protein WD845_06345 [Pirellulales bacterium]
MRRFTAGALLALVLLVWAIAPARAGDVTSEHEALLATYAGQLDELAGWCRQHQLPAAAEELTAWLPPRELDKLTLFVIRSAVSLPTAKDPAPVEWQSRWQKLRDAQAEAIFALAKQAVENHQPSLAYQLVTEAVRENPDHEAGRRMLGYVKFRDAWHTPFEIKQLGSGKIWHEKFGWLLPEHVERYEQGERHYLGRWISAEQEANLRADLKRGWRVESTHYVVTTNHSLEEGVRLSRQLETLHAIWQQVFVAYDADEAELRRRFEGRPPRAAHKPHQVTYFRSREEYNHQLRGVQPQIAITLGIYLDRQRTAYFFAGEDQDAGTLYHEATHQLFQESRPVAANVGRRDNFWIIEGIACYMESLADCGGHFTLGGANAGRMPAARHRLLVDKFYVPLEELVRLGMLDLQRDERLPRIYSQSSGLADFLMHDAGGRFREPLVEYLVAVYSGKADAKTLAELSGADYPTLDRQYAEFMSRDAPPVAARDDAQTTTAGP